MLVVLFAWLVLALVLGLVIGKAIHRADLVEFPERVEPAWWLGTPPRASSHDTGQASARTDEPGVLVA